MILFANLSLFDTVFLIDDSLSMRALWRHTAAALQEITKVGVKYDADGIDIYFLNHRSQKTDEYRAEVTMG